MSTRGTLVVSKSSWHGKIYNFWRQYAEFKNPNNGYRENLCHYMRVVLFWGPLSWFFNRKFFNKDYLRPVSIFIALAVLTAMGITFALAPMEFLTGAGVALVTAAISGGIVAFIVWCANNQQLAKERWLKYGWSWFKFIAIPILVVLFFIPWLIYRLCKWINDNDHWDVVMVGVLVLATMLGLFALGIGVWAFVDEYGWKLLWLTPLALLGVAIIAGLVASIWSFIDMLRGRRKLKYAFAPKDKGDGFFKVTGKYVVAKKHRICPFIDVKE